MATKQATPQFPKFDMEAYLALQRANVETFVAAQKIFYDFAQTVAKRQGELMSEYFAKTETMMKSYDSKKQPQEYVDEAKAAVEKAMADAKETMDLGVKAQTEVVDLLVKRASANFEEVNKTIAA
jgi:phasin family protein